MKEVDKGLRKDLFAVTLYDETMFINVDYGESLASLLPALLLAGKQIVQNNGSPLARAEGRGKRLSYNWSVCSSVAINFALYLTAATFKDKSVAVRKPK